MVRVKKKEKRTAQLNIRMTEEEKKRLDVLSHHSWRSSSEYVRRLINRDWNRLKKVEGAAKANEWFDLFSQPGAKDAWEDFLKDGDVDMIKFKK